MRRIRKSTMAFLLAVMVAFVSVPISSLADEPAAEPKTENALDAPAPDALEDNAEEPEGPDAGQEQTDKSDGTEKQDGEITEETDINEPSEENGTVEDQTPEGDIVPESTEDEMQETVSEESTAEEETQEASEEDTDPAEDVLILTAEAGGVFVQVEALEDGALPEGCQLTAQAADQVDSFAQTIAQQLYEEGGQSLLDIRAFDIRVLDENGEEVHQLDGSVRVTLEGIEAPEGASGASVYHVSDEVSLVTALEGEITSGTVCFETDHFSVYAVAYYQSKEDGIATIAGEHVDVLEEYVLKDHSEIIEQIETDLIEHSQEEKRAHTYPGTGAEEIKAPQTVFHATKITITFSDDKEHKILHSDQTLPDDLAKWAMYVSIYKLKTDASGTETVEYYDKSKLGSDSAVRPEPWSGSGSRPKTICFQAQKEGDTDTSTYLAVYHASKGRLGYNLGLAEDGGAPFTKFGDSNVQYHEQSKEDARKFVDMGTWYDRGDPLQVSSITPIDTRAQDQYTFIAWFDKKQDREASDGRDYAARFLSPGDTTTSYYNRVQGDTQTLDALWARITATPKSKLYDGEPITPTYQVETTFDLNDDYKKQIEAMGGMTHGAITVTWYNEKGEEIKENPKDAGKYTVKLSTEMTVGASSDTKVQKTISTTTTVEIFPREITLKSADLCKVYDGTPLVNGETALLLNGQEGSEEKNKWVAGEGVALNFTGSRTKIGKTEEGNTFSLTPKSGTNLANYTITTQFGSLEVCPSYRIEYYFNGKHDPAEDPTEPHKYKSGPSDPVQAADCFQVGETVSASAGEKPDTKTRKADSKEYVLQRADSITLSDNNDSNVIRIYYILKTIDVKVNKEWQDNKNAQKKRPAEIKIQLKKQKGSGAWENVQELILNEGNSWQQTVNDLPYYEDGEIIQYQVEEPDVPSGYTCKVKGGAVNALAQIEFTITNTLPQPEEKKEDPTPAPEEESSEPSESVPSAPDPKSETETLPQFFPGENDNITPNQEGYLGGIRSMTGRVLGVVNDLMKPVLGAVNTGDDSLSLAALYLVLIGASTGILVFVAVRRRRRRTQNNG